MSAGARLAAFGAALAVLFGAGALAGAAIDPDPGDRDERAGADHDSEEEHGSAGSAHPVRGLGVAERGLRLVLDRRELPRGRSRRIRLRILAGGATVRRFEREHDKRMHLIVARRDLTGFRHLHPRQDDDGSWSTPLRLDQAGSYRLFADFSYEGEPYTLATDLAVDGPADLRALPAPASIARGDGGYRVRREAAAVTAGGEAKLRFAIARGGRRVRPERYLGADGHLVALREGDLAFLHVHPTEDGYEVTFPTAGRYRLFLQFKHEGRVHTVAFTQEVS